MTNQSNSLPKGSRRAIRRVVDFEFAQALVHRLCRDHEIAERNAKVALHGRIREISLPAGNRQFLGKMAEHRTGHAEVAFRIFEIDRVDLVRHRRRADFVPGHFLAEVAE